MTAFLFLGLEECEGWGSSHGLVDSENRSSSNVPRDLEAVSKTSSGTWDSEGVPPYLWSYRAAFVGLQSVITGYAHCRILNLFELVAALRTLDQRLVFLTSTPIAFIEFSSWKRPSRVHHATSVISAHLPICRNLTTS